MVTLMIHIFTDNVFSQVNEIKILSDTGIMRTNSLGNILGGDMNDWDFNLTIYKETISKEYFQTPVFKDSVYIYTPMYSSFTSDVQNNSVILNWFTNAEKDLKGFYIQRARKMSEQDELQWKDLEFIEGKGTSEETRKYEYIDKALKTGIYRYRLKAIYLKDNFQYFELSSEVVIKQYLSKFQFYPAYPNPVISTSTISFFLPKKDTVSLFFLNDVDTIYILDHEPQEKGFYKLTIDKNSLGYKNVIKRLYISCKSCRKEKNFGDIQF